MIKSIAAASYLTLILIGSAGAYDRIAFSPRLTDPKLYEFNLVKESSGEKSKCLWYQGPTLNNHWQKVSFSFISEGDGWVGLRFGVFAPWREGDIPFYLADFQVNGQALEMDESWIFAPPRSGSNSRMGSLYNSQGFTPGGKPCLKVYFGAVAATYNLPVKKGERFEITLQAKAGSVLDAYASRLWAATEQLDECIGLATKHEIPEEAIKSEMAMLTQCVNLLIALSEGELKIQVSALPLGNGSLRILKDKIRELLVAHEEIISRTANSKVPLLFYELAVRKAFIERFRNLKVGIAGLKRDLVLNFIFLKAGR